MSETIQMKEHLLALKEEALEVLEKVATPKELADLRVKYSGKRAH